MKRFPFLLLTEHYLNNFETHRKFDKVVSSQQKVQQQDVYSGPQKS